MAVPQVPQAPHAPQIALPGAGLPPIDECNQYWELFNEARGRLRGINPHNLFGPGIVLSPEQKAAVQKECRTLWRRYNRCMDEKRPGLLRRTLNVLEEEEIRLDLVGEDGPLNGVGIAAVGGRRRRSTRSRRGRRMPKRGSRRNMRK